MAKKPSNAKKRPRREPREVAELLAIPVETTSRGRRRRAEQRQQWVGRFVCWVVAIVGLGVGGYIALQKAFYENPEFTLRTVSIENSGRLSRQEVLVAAKIPLMSNLIELDLSSIRARLLALSEISDVQVNRRLPDALEIVVEERQPVAWLGTEDLVDPIGGELDPARAVGGLLLDREGVAIQCRTLHREFYGLPVIHVSYDFMTNAVALGKPVGNVPVRTALRLLKLWPELHQDKTRVIRSIDARRDYRLDVFCDPEVRILVGLENLEGQMAKLNDVFNHGESNGRSYAMINLTVETNVPVIYHPQGYEPVARPIPIPADTSSSHINRDVSAILAIDS